MLPVALALLLAAAPVADPTRAELDQVAERIEQLKARKLAGEDVTLELERLLVRAQDLVQRIERARRMEAVPPVAAPGPSPEELRERADALRDERDRVTAELREVDARIEAARRERRVEAGLESLTQERALFGDPGASRVAPKAPTATGEPELFAPRAGDAEERTQGTALQRLDRLRAERARLVERQGALDAEAAALDAEATKLAGQR